MHLQWWLVLTDSRSLHSPTHQGAILLEGTERATIDDNLITRVDGECVGLV